MIYKESETQRLKRENSFIYHSPREGQPERYTVLRAFAGDLAKMFNENCPESLELSLAMSNLEQAMFWANASIARNELK